MQISIMTMQIYVATGALLGLFGVISLIVLVALFVMGEFQDLNQFEYMVSAIGGVLRNLILVSAGISVFYSPVISGSLAWSALAVFVIGAVVIATKNKEKFRWSNIKPSFYVTSIFLVTAAAILTYGDNYGA